MRVRSDTFLRLLQQHDLVYLLVGRELGKLGRLPPFPSELRQISNPHAGDLLEFGDHLRLPRVRVTPLRVGRRPELQRSRPWACPCARRQRAS